MRATSQSPKSQTNVESNGTSKVLIDCKIDHLYYGKFLAVRDSHIPIEKGHHGLYWPFGLWQEYRLAVSQSHERPGAWLSFRRVCAFPRP